MRKYQSWSLTNQAYVVHNESKPTVRVPSLRIHARVRACVRACVRARARARVCVCVCVRVNGSVSVGTVVNFKAR